MSLQLNSASGSVTLVPEDGAGNVNVTVPRGGFGGVTGEINPLNNTAGVQVIGLHGFGSTPSSVQSMYECIAADIGYAVGDRVGTALINNGGDIGWLPIVNATQVKAVNGSVPATQIPHASTGIIATMTNASWKLVVTVWA